MTSAPCKEELSQCLHDQQGSPLFTDKVFDRLTAMSAVSDCCLVSSDESRYPVHKAKLLEQSKVFRGLLSDVPSTVRLPLDEDATTVRMLISGMYDTTSDVNSATIQPLLELARKYDVEDIHNNCTRFLENVPLSTSNLPCFMKLACTFGIETAVERYQTYVAADDNFEVLARSHGANWCKDLPGGAVTDMMNRRLTYCVSEYSEKLKTEKSAYRDFYAYVEGMRRAGKYSILLDMSEWKRQ